MKKKSLTLAKKLTNLEKNPTLKSNPPLSATKSDDFCKGELSRGKELEDFGRTNRAKSFKDIMVGKSTKMTEIIQHSGKEQQYLNLQPIILASFHLQHEQPPQISFSDNYLK